MSQKSLKDAKDLLNQKEYDKAVDVCKEILMWNSANYSAYVFMGLALQNLQNYIESEKAYLKAVELEKGSILAYQGLVSLFEAWDKPGSVISPAKTVLHMLFQSREAAKHWDMNEKLVKAFRSSGQEDDAIELLETFLYDEKLREFYGADFKQKDETILLDLIRTLERNNEKMTKKEIDSRKHRLGAPPLSEIASEVEKEIVLHTKLSKYYEKYLLMYAEKGSTEQPELFHRIRISYIKFIFKKITHVEDLHQKDSLHAKMMDLCLEWQRSMKVWDPKPCEILLDFADLTEDAEYDPTLIDLYLKYESKSESSFYSILMGYKCFLEGKLEETRTFLESGLKNYKSSVVGLRTLVRLEKKEKSLEPCLSASIKLKNSLNRLQIKYKAKFVKSIRDCNICMADCYFNIDVKYYANALELYQEVVAGNMNDVDGLEGLCVVFGAMNKSKESVEFGEKVLAIDSSRHKATSEISWQLLLLNDLQRGLEMARNAIEICSDVAIYHYRLGCIYWKLEGEFRTNTDFAYSSFLACVKLDPSFSRAFTKLGHYYLLVEEDRSRAQKCYQKAFSVDNSDEEAALELCKMFPANDEKIVSILEAMLEASPRCFWGWRQLGFLQLRKRLNSESVVSFQTALRLSVNDVACWEGLGEAYMKTGKYLAALKTFKKALEMEPESRVAWLHLGNCQRVLEMYSESIESFEKLIAFNDSRVNVLVYKGLCDTLMQQLHYYKLNGFYGRAASNCFKIIDNGLLALSMDPPITVTFWKLISDAFLEIYDIQRYATIMANDLDQRMSKYFPSDLDYALGFEGAREGDEKRASSPWLNLAVQSSKMAIYCSSNKGIQCHLQWFQLSLFLFYQFKELRSDLYLSLALRCIKTSIEMSPDSFVYWNYLGVYTMNYDPLISQHCFAKSIEFASGTDAQPWINLGFLYLRNNQVELGNKCFSNAQAIDPENLTAWMGQSIIAEHYDYKEFMGLIEHAFDLSLGVNSEVNRIYSLHMFRHWIESKSNDSELLGKIRFALEKYLEIEEKDPYACFLLSLVFERIKKVDDAYGWIERANEYASERVMKYVSKNDQGKLGSSRVLLESIKQNHARILVLSGKYESAIELINGMNDSSQPFYQIMLAVCYMSLMKLDLCIGATNEVLGDPKSNTEQKDYSWLLHCQCLHTMGNKKTLLETAISNWQVVLKTISVYLNIYLKSRRVALPNSIMLLEVECAFGIVYDDWGKFETSIKSLSEKNIEESRPLRKQIGQLLNVGFQIMKMGSKCRTFSSKVVRKAPSCPFSWRNLSRGLLESDSSMTVESCRAAESAIKLFHRSGDDSEQFDLAELYDLLCKSHLAGGKQDAMKGFREAQLAVRLNPSSIKARISLVISFRVQIDAGSVSKSIMRRYKALMDGMKTVVASGKKKDEGDDSGSGAELENKIVLKLLTMDLMFLNSLVAGDDEKRRREHLTRAFKEADKLIKASSSEPLLQGIGYWFMGRVLLGLDEPSKSLVSYKNAIQFNPNNYLLWMLGYNEASDWVDERIKTIAAPSRAVEFLYRAKGSLKLMVCGNFTHAYEWLQRAREIMSELEQMCPDSEQLAEYRAILVILGDFLKSKKLQQ